MHILPIIQYIEALTGRLMALSHNGKEHEQQDPDTDS
jgi:hypothetical protein